MGKEAKRRGENKIYILFLIVFVLGVAFGSQTALNGLPVVGGFENKIVRRASIYERDKKVQIDIFSDNLPFRGIEADIKEVKVIIDPQAAGTLVSSKDSFIWDNYRPNIKKVTITVRTEKLKKQWEDKLNTAFQPPKPQDIAPY